LTIFFFPFFTGDEAEAIEFIGGGICGCELVRSSGRSSLLRRERTSGERDREREGVSLETSRVGCEPGGTNLGALLEVIAALPVCTELIDIRVSRVSDAFQRHEIGSGAFGSGKVEDLALFE